MSDELLRAIGAHFDGDRRIPLPDARALLADFQLRINHFDSVATEVHYNWSGICAINCNATGMIEGNLRPRFSIHIDPFNSSLQRKHWPVADYMEGVFGSPNFTYLFLPTRERSFPNEFNLYDRATYCSPSLT